MFISQFFKGNSLQLFSWGCVHECMHTHENVHAHYMKMCTHLCNHKITKYGIIFMFKGHFFKVP